MSDWKYNRAYLRETSAAVIERPVKPAGKKRSKVRPFTIEVKYSQDFWWTARKRDWHVCDRYETAKQRDQALAQHKKRNYRFAEYRAGAVE